MGPPAYDGTKHAAGTHGLRWGPNNVVSSGCRDGSVALWDPNTKTNMILGGGHDGDADPTGRATPPARTACAGAPITS